MSGSRFAGVGGDLAAEAGSVVLLGDPLAALPETIRLARQTVRVIRQNILFFAFGFNAVAVGAGRTAGHGPRRRGDRPPGRLAPGPVERDPAAGLRAVAHIWIRPCRRAGRRRLPAVPALGGARPGVAIAAIDRSHRDRRWRSLAYLGSGITVIEPDQVGVCRRFGRYRPPLLRPGLHLRWPAPVESVTVVEPDRSRLARIGLPGPASAAVQPVGWNATHGVARDESALFFTGDENLVELAGVVEYRYTEAELAELLFNVADVEDTVSRAAEGVFREVVGRTTLEAILVERPAGIRGDVAQALQAAAACLGPGRGGRAGAGGRRAPAARGGAGLPRRLVGRVRRRTEPEPRRGPTPPGGTGRRSPRPRQSATPPGRVPTA